MLATPLLSLGVKKPGRRAACMPQLPSASSSRTSESGSVVAVALWGCLHAQAATPGMLQTLVVACLGVQQCSPLRQTHRVARGSGQLHHTPEVHEPLVRANLGRADAVPARSQPQQAGAGCDSRALQMKSGPAMHGSGPPFGAG